MGKTTNKLLAIAARCGGRRAEARRLASCDELREFHLRESAGLDVDDIVEAHFQELEALVRGLAVMRELTPRATDAISAYGERLSSMIVAAHLRRCGMDAAHLDSRSVIVTDRRHTQAAPLFEETNRRLRETLVPMLDHQVVVMGGFIGVHGRRRDHDARPRRIGLHRVDRRRGHRRGGDPDLDRRRRHAHRRSHDSSRAAIA